MVKTRGSTAAGVGGVTHGQRFSPDLFTEMWGSVIAFGIVRNTIWAAPYVPRTTRTVNGIAFFATVAVGVNVLAGIYADNGNTPIGGARLAVSASTPVAVGFNLLTIANTVLTAGELYYIAVNYDTNFTACSQSNLIGTLVMPATEAHNWTNNTGAYALPDPFPAGAVAAVNYLPSTYLKIASIP